MGRTLFEQYLAAKEVREAEQGKRLEAWEAEQKEERFGDLCEIIENEDLDLKLTNCQYVVCTKEGDPVSDYFDSLDEVEAWLEDPGFIFSGNDQEKQQSDNPPFDLDDDPDDDAGVTVGQMNRFEFKFSQTAEDPRELILRRLFDIDQQGRKCDFDNANLRWKSVEDLYWLLNNGHQEQIRRYMILLLADQKCGG